MGYDEHRRLSRDTPVACAVLTVSDTRTEETDRSGRLMRDLLTEAGHAVGRYRIVPDDVDAIREALDDAAAEADVALFNGGTGISKRDSTFEAVSARLEKTLPGFGELFRMLSFEEIGAGAMLSRATAGVYRDTVVFCTPGSTNAVRLAMERLIVPELEHLVWELIRQQRG